jgi:hypothetical protein
MLSQLELMQKANEIAAAVDCGRISAAKRGRNPKFPYVPVIDFGTRTEQVRCLAYVTREEALAAAAATIQARRNDLRQKLMDPRYRALREQYGLPRDIKVEG